MTYYNATIILYIAIKLEHLDINLDIAKESIKKENTSEIYNLILYSLPYVLLI